MYDRDHTYEFENIIKMSNPQLFGNTASSKPFERILLKQGAEAHVYKSAYLLPTLPCLIKARPSKTYRHTILDVRLTKHRCISEARLLNRCRLMGVPCPALYFVDDKQGEITMEWIEGPSVRDFLNSALELGVEDTNELDNTKLGKLMEDIGRIIAKLHNIEVVHGDLTTSNLMLRKLEQETADECEALPEYDVVLIDFGLGQVSASDEDKAVDLYVLERAFLSTHPKASALFRRIIESYTDNSVSPAVVLRRLQEVRLRGRKKSMIG
ncbi:serine/threonine-protein kinase bud32 [Orbilia ellipsospora]|uniref:EKC/KEOPS complex subunit BUD32 n=1 Tax=Orbilia ellipsospora TaxID=2528407 RepID=A0AAV9XIX5_9PEZI